MSFDVQAIWELTIAVLGGLAVGIEREWSGHATGPHARFAGVRTFTLLGLVAGLSGWLWNAGLEGPALVFLAGLGGLVIVAYLSASKRDVDGTTEVAAFVVMIAAVLAGAGHTRVASAIVALTVLLLVEKKQLHQFVRKLDRAEIRAGARFGVMAAIVLPLLPAGPYGPLGGVRPQLLWALVLFFSGLSFIGYALQRVLGPQKGFALAGTLGGMLSSTSVTLTFSRLSRSQPDAGIPLASGTIGASVMLLPRVLLAGAILAPALSAALWPAFLIPSAIGIGLVFVGLRKSAEAHPPPADKNPLKVGAALQMALLFQLVLFAVEFSTRTFGQAGLFGSAAVMGLVDLDALTISMARQTADGSIAAALTARAVVIGIIANTGVKMAIALAVGRGPFRWRVAAGLAAMGAALAAACYFFSTC